MYLFFVLDEFLSKHENGDEYRNKENELGQIAFRVYKQRTTMQKKQINMMPNLITIEVKRYNEITCQGTQDTY